MSFSNQPVGSAVASCPGSASSSEQPKHWIEILLVGQDDSPIPYEDYKVVLPDGTVVNGCLDQNGSARLQQIASAGDCQISFPKLDQDAWMSVL
jgi:hypothetical protein